MSSYSKKSNTKISQKKHESKKHESKKHESKKHESDKKSNKKKSEIKNSNNHKKVNFEKYLNNTDNKKIINNVWNTDNPTQSFKKVIKKISNKYKTESNKKEIL